jgi:hypothetical protein
VSKYIAKVDEAAISASAHCRGRRWGVKGRQFIPWGKRVVSKCTRGQAARLMRWGRRCIRSITGRDYRFSRVAMNIYIKDSAQWMRLIQYVLAQPETPF